MVGSIDVGMEYPLARNQLVNASVVSPLRVVVSYGPIVSMWMIVTPLSMPFSPVDLAGDAKLPPPHPTPLLGLLQVGTGGESTMGELPASSSSKNSPAASSTVTLPHTGRIHAKF